MRKLFTDFPIGGTFSLTEADSRHVVTVLRRRRGDMIEVTDSTGTTYSCRIVADDRTHTVLKPETKLSARNASAGQVVLAAGLLKGDRFEWVVQKAAELGASAIVPVQMERCVVKLTDTRRQDRQIRWQRIAREAAQQCGRNDIPEVQPVVSFAELLTQYSHFPFLIPYEEETAPLQECCARYRQGDVLICIGPEGGFAPSEIKRAEAVLAQCCTVSLGPRILRAETAALAALSILMYERGFM